MTTEPCQCGSEAHRWMRTGVKIPGGRPMFVGMWQIHCTACGSRGPLRKDKDSARLRWNWMMAGSRFLSVARIPAPFC